MSSSFNIDAYCRECNVYCGTPGVLAKHQKGAKHQSIAVKQQRHCGVCDQQVPGGTIAWAQHVQGARHIKKLGDKTTLKRDRYCNVCKKYPLKAEDKTHLESTGHLLKQKWATVARVFLEAEKDKFTVTVKPDKLDFGIIHPSSSGPTDVSRAVTIKAAESGIRIVSCHLGSSVQTHSERSPSFDIRGSFPKNLNHNAALSINISFDTRTSFGYFNDTIELVFESISRAQRFTITRGLSARVGNPADLEALQAIGPYARPPKNKSQPKLRSKRRLRPEGGLRTTIPYERELLHYNLPTEEIIAIGTLEQRIDHIRGLMPESVTAESYMKHWQTLLWVEEDQMKYVLT
ncbi:hypothetical protein FRC02_002808 [Tulasnella sp. 418]|nr:hypothetical protein FRC02_002808 [Tulasnella sp. 418]